MRFAELHLVPYGNFDDCRILFPRASQDLQLVYGPNEAGKSTTMAAVSDLLFGFPHTTVYDYRFNRQLLRVGATLEGHGGTIVCRRRKGTKATLVDAHDNLVSEQPLMTMLSGQTRESFTRMFSLDHHRLRAGGKAILAAEDDAGQAIFAAGSGLTRIVQLADALKDEADQIWSEHASQKRKYYIATREFEEAKGRLKSSQLKSKDWAELKKTFEDANDRLGQCREAREAIQREIFVVGRIRRVLSPLATHRHLDEELIRLGSLPELPTDAGVQLRNARAVIAEAETEHRIATDRHTALNNEREGLSFDPRLLSVRSRVPELRSEMGAVDKARGDKPELEARIQLAMRQIERLTAELGWAETDPDQLKASLPGRPQVAQLQALITQKSVLASQQIAAEEELGHQKSKLEDIAKAIHEISVSTAGESIEAVVLTARAKGDLSGLRVLAAQALQTSEEKLKSALASLTPWTGSVEQLVSLVLPADETIAQLVERVTRAAQSCDTTDRLMQEKSEQFAARKRERDLLARDSQVVPPEVLSQARAVRNEVWTELSDQLRAKRMPENPDHIIADFNARSTRADDLADRRFFGAEKYALVVTADLDIERLELAHGQAQTGHDDAKIEKEAALETWRTLVASIGASLLPTEYRNWLNRRERTLGLIDQVARDTRAVEAIDAQIGEVRSALLSLPLAVNETQRASLPLSVLLNAAEQLDGAFKSARLTQQQLKADQTAADAAFRRAEKEMGAVTGALTSWWGQWSGSLAGANLSNDGEVEVVKAQLQILEELGGAINDVSGWKQRIGHIDLDLAKFEIAVAALCGEAGLTESGAGPTVAFALLEQALADALQKSDRTDSLGKQLKETNTLICSAEEKLAKASAVITPLLTFAGVATADELDQVIQRVERQRQILNLLDQTAKNLLEQGDGLNFEQLTAEADGHDAADLASRHATLTETEHGVANDMEQYAKDAKAAEQAFHANDSSTEAVSAAADRELARSEMVAQAEAYLAKRAEIEMLNWSISRYREEKQAPLLRRASEIFSILTLGKYDGLDVDFDTERPQLSAVAAGRSTIVPVSGLSEGTLDQLYLSLRLAAVEDSVESGVKLPFLADDLFINYDDERAAAGFKVLAQLAEKTQVLFFTHHPHLLEVARKALHPVIVTACSLDARSAA